MASRRRLPTGTLLFKSHERGNSIQESQLLLSSPFSLSYLPRPSILVETNRQRPKIFSKVSFISLGNEQNNQGTFQQFPNFSSTRQTEKPEFPFEKFFQPNFLTPKISNSKTSNPQSSPFLNFFSTKISPTQNRSPRNSQKFRPSKAEQENRKNFRPKISRFSQEFLTFSIYNPRF